MRFVRWFSEVGLSDVDLVGGKNASLGEMIRELAPLGIRVPDGFAVTAEAYREFLRAAELERPIDDLLSGVRREDINDLVERSARIRRLILSSDLPDEIAHGGNAAISAVDRECGPRAMATCRVNVVDEIRQLASNLANVVTTALEARRVLSPEGAGEGIALVEGVVVIERAWINGILHTRVLFLYDETTDFIRCRHGDNAGRTRHAPAKRGREETKGCPGRVDVQ